MSASVIESKSPLTPTLHYQICSVVAAVFVCWLGLGLIIGGNCKLSVTAHQQTIDHSNSLPPAQTMLWPRHHINPSNDSQIIYFIVQRQWLDTINRMRTWLQVLKSSHSTQHRIHSTYSTCSLLLAGLNIFSQISIRGQRQLYYRETLSRTAI